MRDDVELIVGNRNVSSWESYSVAADLYSASGTFELAMSTAVKADIAEGSLVKLKVNGTLAITGIVDVIDESYSKDKNAYSVSGRDLMGLVIDEHCEAFQSFEGYSLKRVAETMLSPIPYIGRDGVAFEDAAGKQVIAESADRESVSPFCATKPGDTAFDFLRAIATARGYLFYCRADGKLVFRKVKPKAKALFALTRTEAGSRRAMATNILTGARNRDLSKHFRKVLVIGQQQGTPLESVEDISVMGQSVDTAYPLTHKTFVARFNEDAGTATQQAKVIMNEQRRQGFSLTYTTKGHSQNGHIWTVNEFCHVYDERFGLNGAFLIISRAFRRSKDAGTITEVKLGKLEL